MALLQKIFQHDVCNNNFYSKTCVQWVRYSNPRYTANNVSIILWSMKRSGSARHSSTITCFNWSIVSNFLPWYTRSCMAPNGVSTRFKNPGCRGARPAQRRRHSHAACRWQIRAMCDDVPSCCRVHSWRPLASYAFIKIKITSSNLLHYVVYMRQK